MRKINLQNLIWKEGKHYVSKCTNVEVSSFGKTKKEASTNLKEALDLYFEDISASKAIKNYESEKKNGKLEKLSSLSSLA